MTKFIEIMYINQLQLNNLHRVMAPNKVVVIYGPRRCGKTTLLQKLIQTLSKKVLFLNGEDITVQDHLSSQSIEKLKALIGSHEVLIVDEAQKVKNIGLNLKLIVDHIREIQVVVTGSSAFDLAHHTGEPLTGRKYTLRLFPLAQMEIGAMESPIQTESNREARLVYGSYPEVILIQDNLMRERYLKEIVGSYLYKDILELEGVRYSEKLVRLLQLLAFQIGKEVSFNELGGQLSMSKNTVERYLDLLEKAFVIYRLTGFSRNLRKEVSKNARYYFYDSGIRNALINNFNGLALRNDVGMLWENYIIIERLKKQEYHFIASNNYFWRTYDQKEIDFVEEREGKLYGYEIKWGRTKNKVAQSWLKTYSNASFRCITPENYLEFII